jgi:hypothetical protein
VCPRRNALKLRRIDVGALRLLLRQPGSEQPQLAVSRSLHSNRAIAVRGKPSLHVICDKIAIHLTPNCQNKNE